MPKLYLETNKKDAATFELIQEKKVGFEVETRFFIQEIPERIDAVILNVGLACRYVYEVNSFEPVISLLDDRDTASGNNEQYEVYSILCDKKTFREKHLHFTGIYGKEKMKYLDRIMFLIEQWKIKIELH